MQRKGFNVFYVERCIAIHFICIYNSWFLFSLSVFYKCRCHGNSCFFVGFGPGETLNIAFGSQTKEVWDPLLCEVLGPNTHHEFTVEVSIGVFPAKVNFVV